MIEIMRDRKGMDQRVHVTSQRHESENICEHVSSEAPHAVDVGTVGGP